MWTCFIEMYLFWFRTTFGMLTQMLINSFRICGCGPMEPLAAVPKLCHFVVNLDKPCERVAISRLSAGYSNFNLSFPTQWNSSSITVARVAVKIARIEIDLMGNNNFNPLVSAKLVACSQKCRQLNQLLCIPMRNLELQFCMHIYQRLMVLIELRHNRWNEKKREKYRQAQNKTHSRSSQSVCSNLIRVRYATISLLLDTQ